MASVDKGDDAGNGGEKKKTGKVVWIFTCQIAKLRYSFSKIEVPMIY